MNAPQLKSLLKLQKNDLTLIQLKKEAQNVPERQEQIRKNAQSARDQASAAHDAVKACENAIKQIELEVETAKEQINKYKTQQMQARTNEEYKAFEKEIATAGGKIGELEDRELLEMTRLDEVKAEWAKALEVEKAAEAQVATEVQELEERLNVIRSTFADVKEGREELVAQIDKEITTRYMQLLNKNQNAVIVPIRQKSCGGCHMTLTPQTLHDAHSQQKWTVCNFCGRYLYDDGEG
ncbi:C4-type zinc ribbon domain-containing protein [Kiritimatiellaeota bacterium B1221]|nr:C4-type zinc ribbon domain-containing protein [Kiritimatiellaeota bacterium B1221]